MTIEKKQHLMWVDVLRIVACFMVVLSHSIDPFTARLDASPTEFFTAAYMGSLMRSCVPLFVMISGVLLLPVKMDMVQFYKKRAKRIVIPLIVWALIMPIAYFLYLNYGISATESPLIDMNNYTWGATVKKMYTWVFNFNYDITPLWYVYMLIGLYLFLPVLGAWVDKATQKEMKIFLSIWLFTTFLPAFKVVAPLLGYDGGELLGVCDWNAYGTFYYFSGFIGYLVLGHYLVKYPLKWSWTKTLAIIVPAFLIGYIMTTQGFLKMQELYPGNYPFLEIPWMFTGFNVMLMTVSMFVLFQKVEVKSKAFISKLSSLTFGIFLIHFFIVQVGYDLIYPNIKTLPFIQIILVAIFSFIISLLITWLLSLNKITKKSIM